ncbi:MAG: aminoacyl-tRNA hydrolase [Candidatus Aminicenantes bacterium]|nr:aminoacyl-tRNA hydrolase [Candidatus Aminicenantes bacterium]
MWVVVGLGNPGQHYSQTRHNVGFMFIRRVAKAWDVRLKKRMYLSKGIVVNKDNDKILLVMPQTYMNNSGQALSLIVKGTKIELPHLIVVYDDLDIPLGEIRVRKEGRAGFHKGMISIIQELETSKFPRIRIGIGPLPEDVDAADFVLSPFQKEEMPLLDKSLTIAQEALELILSGEIDRAMSIYNQRYQDVN